MPITIVCDIDTITSIIEGDFGGAQALAAYMDERGLAMLVITSADYSNIFFN